MERRLNGMGGDSFLIAKDVAEDTGFSAARGGSMAIRHQFGGTGLTVSAETGAVALPVQSSINGSPYRWTSVTADRSIGKNNWVSLGLSRLDEKNSLLGGQMSTVLGGGGSNSTFLDAEVRHDFGSGWGASLTARRGWTNFAAGNFATGAYAFDVAKSGLFGSDDRLGLRLSQPLRVEQGGFAMLLPVAYDYTTGSATTGFRTMSLRPNGREIDTELSYGSRLLGGNAWLGGNLFYRNQPGHIADAAPDAGAAVRFTLGF